MVGGRENVFFPIWGEKVRERWERSGYDVKLPINTPLIYSFKGPFGWRSGKVGGWKIVGG